MPPATSTHAVAVATAVELATGEAAQEEGLGAVPVLSLLPPDVLQACLEPLGVLELLRCRPVSRAISAESLRLLRARRCWLLAGTYSVTSWRRQAHPSQIWAEDLMHVDGAGTLTLRDDGTLDGRLEELGRAPQADAGQPAAAARCGGRAIGEVAGVAVSGWWRADGALARERCAAA